MHRTIFEMDVAFFFFKSTYTYIHIPDKIFFNKLYLYTRTDG